MVRRLAVLLVALLTVTVAGSVPVGADELPEVPDGVNSIIGPPPGQGVAPEDPGDRGGWLQLTVFGLIVVAIGGIVARVVRDARRDGRGGRRGVGADGPEAAHGPAPPV